MTGQVLTAGGQGDGGEGGCGLLGASVGESVAIGTGESVGSWFGAIGALVGMEGEVVGWSVTRARGASVGGFDGSSVGIGVGLRRTGGSQFSDYPMFPLTLLWVHQLARLWAERWAEAWGCKHVTSKRVDK